MPKILSIFCGGLGYKTLQIWSDDQINQLKSQGIDLLYLDTHINQINQLNSLIECLSANTQGAGGSYDAGIEKFQHIKQDMSAKIKNYDMIFITAGMGGGTGSSFTTELVKICNDLNKFKVVVGNSLKFEEFYQEMPKFNYELVIDEIQNSTPYLIIDSSKIEDYLCNHQLQKLEYERYFANLCYDMINSFYLLSQQGIDTNDLKNLLPSGKIHFGISQVDTPKEAIKNLLNDEFLIANSSKIRSYTLLYPSNISQYNFNQILDDLEGNLRVSNSKLRPIDNQVFYLLGSLQTVYKHLQTPLQTAQTVDNNQLLSNSLFATQTPTNSLQTVYKHLQTVSKQHFLELIWEAKNLQKMSLGEAETFINSNLTELTIEFGVNLENEITRSAINYFKQKNQK
jgi:Tubulin/FtsZ family, GTPase domain